MRAVPPRVRTDALPTCRGHALDARPSALRHAARSSGAIDAPHHSHRRMVRSTDLVRLDAEPRMAATAVATHLGTTLVRGTPNHRFPAQRHCRPCSQDEGSNRFDRICPPRSDTRNGRDSAQTPRPYSSAQVAAMCGPIERFVGSYRGSNAASVAGRRTALAPIHSQARLVVRDSTGPPRASR